MLSPRHLSGILMGILLGASVVWALAGETPSAKDSPAAPKAPAKSADQIPDGTPAEMLAAMEKMLQPDPEYVSQVGEQQALIQTLARIIKTADKVLADANASDQDKTEAYKFKISMLHQGILYQVAEYAGQLRTLAEELLKSQPKGELAPMAGYLSIRAEYQQSGDLAPSTLPRTQAFIKSFAGNEMGISLLQEIGMIAEMTGRHAEAKQAYLLIQKHFSDHPMAEQVAGSIRRLDLPGKPMKISGTTLDGKPFDIGSLKGKVVLVDFWATWCGPCMAEMPHLREVYEKYRDKGFEIVGISLDEDKQALEESLADAKMPWIQVYFSEENKRGFENPIANYYGISAIPAMFLIDAKGNVAHLSVRGPVLEELVANLMVPPATDEAQEKPAQ